MKPTKRALTIEIEDVLRSRRFEHQPLQSPKLRREIAEECAEAILALLGQEVKT
jgi:hypothetical protein